MTFIIGTEFKGFFKDVEGLNSRIFKNFKALNSRTFTLGIEFKNFKN